MKLQTISEQQWHRLLDVGFPAHIPFDDISHALALKWIRDVKRVPCAVTVHIESRANFAPNSNSNISRIVYTFYTQQNLDMGQTSLQNPSFETYEKAENYLLDNMTLYLLKSKDLCPK
jgi:hypothetical protein